MYRDSVLCEVVWLKATISIVQVGLNCSRRTADGGARFHRAALSFRPPKDSGDRSPASDSGNGLPTANPSMILVPAPIPSDELGLGIRGFGTLPADGRRERKNEKPNSIFCNRDSLFFQMGTRSGRSDRIILCERPCRPCHLGRKHRFSRVPLNGKSDRSMDQQGMTCTTNS